MDPVKQTSRAPNRVSRRERPREPAYRAASRAIDASGSAPPGQAGMLDGMGAESGPAARM